MPGRLAPVYSTHNAKRQKLSVGGLGEATNTDLNLLQKKNGICKNTLDVQGNGQCTHIERKMKHVNSEATMPRNVLFSYVQKRYLLCSRTDSYLGRCSRGGGCKDIYTNINVPFNKHSSEEISGKPAPTKVWMYNTNEPKRNVWLKTL